MPDAFQRCHPARQTKLGPFPSWMCSECLARHEAMLKRRLNGRETDGRVAGTCAVCGRSFVSAYARRCCSPVCTFWSMVDRSGGEAACWPWLGHISPNSGYGDVPERYGGGKRCTAHRMAWRLHNCCDPSSLFVLHRCDFRPCCNPEHLFLASARRNVLDAWRKGRLHACAPGEDHPRSKLTDDAVRHIRQCDDSAADMAELYGVTVGTIRSARRGTTWKHLPMSAAE